MEGGEAKIEFNRTDSVVDLNDGGGVEGENSLLLSRTSNGQEKTQKSDERKYPSPSKVNSTNGNME